MPRTGLRPFKKTMTPFEIWQRITCSWSGPNAIYRCISDDMSLKATTSQFNRQLDTMLVHLKKPASFRRSNVLAGLCPKGMCAKKIRGAEQKSGLKPPLSGVDSQILANFLLHYVRSYVCVTITDP